MEQLKFETTLRDVLKSHIIITIIHVFGGKKITVGQATLDFRTHHSFEDGTNIPFSEQVQLSPDLRHEQAPTLQGNIAFKVLRVSSVVAVCA